MQTGVKRANTTVVVVLRIGETVPLVLLANTRTRQVKATAKAAATAGQAITAGNLQTHLDEHKMCECT